MTNFDSSQLNKAWLKDMMQRHGFAPRQRLGQNFVTDGAVLDAMADAADLTTADHVIEIGPGLGTLTVKLASRAGRVTAVEYDKGLCGLLQERFAEGGPVQIVQADGVKYLKSLSRLPEPDLVKLAGNIPYYITSPLLLMLWEFGPRCPLAVFMVQREVAQRLAAPTGTREAGALSVLLQMEHTVELLDAVPRSLFWPQPDVDSQIIRVRLRPEQPVEGEARDFFRRLIHAFFMKRRKTLRNALRAAAGPLGLATEPAELLRLAGIDPDRRGETLNLSEIRHLGDVIRRGSPPSA